MMSWESLGHILDEWRRSVIGFKEGSQARIFHSAQLKNSFNNYCMSCANSCTYSTVISIEDNNCLGKGTLHNLRATRMPLSV